MNDKKCLKCGATLEEEDGCGSAYVCGTEVDTDGEIVLESEECLRNQNAQLRAKLDKLPSKQEIEYTFAANGMWNRETKKHQWVKTLCRCDPDVGMVPCEYCQTWDTLIGLYEVKATAEA